MRLLAVSYIVPVRASGTAVVIRRLLENLDPNEVVLLARTSGAEKELAQEGLDYPIVKIPIANRGGSRYRMIAAVPLGIVQGLVTLLRYKPKAIVGFFPDEGALLTSYVLHRLSGLPFYPYLCDLYLEAGRKGWRYYLARWLQPRVLQAAAKLLVVNEGMGAFFKDKYGIDAVVIPTAINSPIPDTLAFNYESLVDATIIGFSGNITIERLDTIQMLVQAIGNNSTYHIRYFTPQTQSQLERMGVWANNCSIDFARTADEMATKLSECDILYLPLSFQVEQSSIDQLRTCFGIKSYDYLVSGRPILVHCPATYYTATFYKENDCGAVVGTPSKDDLLLAIQQLQSDDDLKARIVANAIRAAKKFEGRRVIQIFRQVTSLEG